MNSFQVNQVFDVFRFSHWPADMATHPVKRQRFVSAELTGKLKAGTEVSGTHEKALEIVLVSSIIMAFFK